MIHDEAEDEEAALTLAGYLALLHTLCIAYAKAGVTKRQGEPGNEKRGTASVDFVECPLDVMLRYYHRAERKAHNAGTGALAWLLEHDEAERAA